MKAAGFGGQIKFVLKAADKADIIDSFILDLDNIYQKEDILTEIVNGYKLTFKVTKDNEEVELKNVSSDFQGVLNIPAKIGSLKVTTLGPECCFYNNGTSEVHVPEGVKSIGEYAFYWNESLTKLYLPSTITEIAERAFDTGLSEIHIKATTPPSLGFNAFGSFAFHPTLAKIPLYVPKECKVIYANAEQWKKFENIVEE